MTKRYTPEQLKDLAKQYDCGAEDYHYSRQISDALHQAASDAARMAELEADKERLDWLVSECRTADLFRLFPSWSGDYSLIRAAIDAARSRT